MKLSSLLLENFKCFRALQFPLAPLTLLTGYNSAGKSTVGQALLLLSQGLKQAPNQGLLPLNGNTLSLGSGRDVLCHQSVEPWIRLGVAGGNETYNWKFSYLKELGARGLMQLESIDVERQLESKLFSGERLLPATLGDSALLQAVQGLKFLGAARGSQPQMLPVPHLPAQFTGDVGVNGEFSAFWYLECADEEVFQARRHPENDRETVRSQVDAWMGELFPGARVNADRLAVDAPIRLAFSLSKTSPWSKPANVGFGLSYAFPMIVSLLTSRTGSIVMVDSAEAHLHPRAQSSVGRLFSRMAASGLQIILETHSDHLLNGVRLAVRDGVIEPDDVMVHFFGTGGDTGRITMVSMERTGAISDWPEGFFDQTERDLSALAGWT